MSIVSLKDAEAGLSSLVDEAVRGEFVTITRHGQPIAALVPIAAAEIARKALDGRRPSLVDHLRTYPGGEAERDPTPSRDIGP